MRGKILPNRKVPKTQQTVGFLRPLISQLALTASPQGEAKAPHQSASLTASPSGKPRPLISQLALTASPQGEARGGAAPEGKPGVVQPQGEAKDGKSPERESSGLGGYVGQDQSKSGTTVYSM